MNESVHLDATSVAAIADTLAPAVARLVVEALAVRREDGTLLTAAQVAERFGVERAWVYANAQALGVIRIGNGRKPRLRFDAHEVDLALRLADTSSGPAGPGSGGRARNMPGPPQRLLPGQLASLPKRWQDAIAADRSKDV